MNRITGHPSKGRLVKRLGAMVLTARVHRVYVENGLPWVECGDPSTANYWPMVALMTRGGGPSVFEHVAVSEDPIRPHPSDGLGGAAEALLVVPGPGRAPYVVALFYHASTGLETLTLSPVPGADRTRDVGVRDHCRANGGSREILDERGAWTLDLTGATDPTSDPNARVQLPSAGVLRVSRSGAATERTVLAGALIAYLGQLEAKVNELEALVRAASNGGGALVVGPSLVTTPTAGNALKAAAIHVSAVPEVP